MSKRPAKMSEDIERTIKQLEQLGLPDAARLMRSQERRLREIEREHEKRLAEMLGRMGNAPKEDSNEEDS